MVNEDLARRHDIGFPFEKPPRSQEFKKRFEHLRKQRSDFNLEQAARAKKCKIQFDIVLNIIINLL